MKNLLSHSSRHWKGWVLSRGMEGTWQWEQRKHCHIILLNLSSHVKENPEQAAGESFDISRFFARPGLLTVISRLNSLEGEKNDSQKSPVLATRTIMPFYILVEPPLTSWPVRVHRTFEKEILCRHSNYRINRNIRCSLEKPLYRHEIFPFAWPLTIFFFVPSL